MTCKYILMNILIMQTCNENFKTTCSLAIHLICLSNLPLQCLVITTQATDSSAVNVVTTAWIERSIFGHLLAVCVSRRTWKITWKGSITQTTSESTKYYNIITEYKYYLSLFFKYLPKTTWVKVTLSDSILGRVWLKCIQQMLSLLSYVQPIAIWTTMKACT